MHLLRLLVPIVAIATVALAHAGPPDTLEARLRACTGCHGDQGRAAPDGYQPRIAGKPAGYLHNQLLNFRDGRRPVPVMTWMVQHLPDAYLREIAGHFADRHPPHPPPVPVAASPATLVRGRQLVVDGDPSRRVPACAACHGTALLGVQPAVPGLLGLPRDYLNAQFGAWRNGDRRAMAPDCMAEVSRRLAPEDIAAVTTWLAAQPVPEPARPAGAAPGPLPLPCGGLDGADAAEPAAIRGAAAEPAPADTSSPAARGAYLARVGNCAGCHTPRGGAPYAGGRAIATPFGTLYTTNLTPDPETGLGRWSRDDFERAMRRGISRDGRPLYPAFPYPEYSRLTDADVDALWAYVRTLAPVHAAPPEPALRFPWNLRPLLWAWRALYFRPAVFVPDPARDTAWNRGAYLVEGPGHCGACHTARDAFGAARGTPLAGSMMTAQGSYAPSLRRAGEGGVQRWSLAQTEAWLADGVNDHAVASGPMAAVIAASLQHLDRADRQAMATYLRALPEDPPPPPTRSSPARLDAAAATKAAALYREHCAECHGADGEGAPPHWPALAGNRALAAEPPVNAIRAVLHGGFAPGTRGNARPYGMPPAGPALADGEVALLLTWLRGSWGHAASPVAAHQVNRWRAVPLE